MSADPRESILARLEALLGTITDVRVYRNAEEIPDERLKRGPVVSINDGDESVDDSSYGKGRPASGPVIVTMRPEIFAAPKFGDDSGADVNLLRAQIVKLVMSDETLLALCKDRDIRYEGATTAFAQGRSMLAEVSIGFAFVYVLRPSQL